MFPRLYILHAKRAVSPESKVTLPGLNLSSISVAVLPTKIIYLSILKCFLSNNMTFLKYVSLSSLIIHIESVLHELKILRTYLEEKMHKEVIEKCNYFHGVKNIWLAHKQFLIGLSMNVFSVFSLRKWLLFSSQKLIGLSNEEQQWPVF